MGNNIFSMEYKAAELVVNVTEDILIYMEDNNISISELAKKLSVKESRIRKLLSGEKNMTLIDLSNICSVLDISVKIKISDVDRNNASKK